MLRNRKSEGAIHGKQNVVHRRARSILSSNCSHLGIGLSRYLRLVYLFPPGKKVCIESGADLRYAVYDRWLFR